MISSEFGRDASAAQLDSPENLTSSQRPPSIANEKRNNKEAFMADRKGDLPAPGQQPPQRKALPPFEGLRAFDAIARLGGVRKAAKWLDRDHAVLSRHLRTLEEWVGITLVERAPTGLILTEAGKDYLKSIAAALDMVESVELESA